MLALNTSVGLSHYFDEIALLCESCVKSLHVRVNVITKPFIRIPFKFLIYMVFPDETIHWVSQTMELVEE